MRVIRFISVLAVALAVACSNTTHQQNGLTLPSALAAGNGTVSGSLTTYSSGQAVSGGTVKLGTVSAISDSSGAFKLIGTPESGPGVITASAPNFVFRGVAFNLTPTKSGAQLDLIRDAAPFSLTFYREFARNAVEGTSLEAIRRWTVNPSFYFQVVTVGSGLRVPDDVIQSIKDNFTRSVPEITNNRFSVAAFDQGDGPKDPTDGWVNVVFRPELISIGCGNTLGCSTVGGNMGTINIVNDPTIPSTNSTNPYHCASIPLQTADHEIIHTMGFWHTENTGTDEFSGEGCPGVGRPANTLYHANIAYSRPVGNIDPDVDPVSTAHAIAPGGSRRLVACDFSRFTRR